MVQVEIFIMSWVCILIFMSERNLVAVAILLIMKRCFLVFCCIGSYCCWEIKNLISLVGVEPMNSRKERMLFKVYTLMGHFNRCEKWGINRGKCRERNEGGRKWEKILSAGTYSVKMCRVGRSLGESCQTSINKLKLVHFCWHRSQQGRDAIANESQNTPGFGPDLSWVVILRLLTSHYKTSS